MPLLAAADTPAIDSKALGPPDRVLFWTPDQQRASYPNMDRIFLTREISRGDPKTHPAYPLPVALEDLSKVAFEVAGKRYTIADYLERNRVAGLLVIHNGKIAYEHYALGHTRHEQVDLVLGREVADLDAGRRRDQGRLHQGRERSGHRRTCRCSRARRTRA